MDESYKVKKKVIKLPSHFSQFKHVKQLKSLESLKSLHRQATSSCDLQANRRKFMATSSFIGNLIAFQMKFISLINQWFKPHCGYHTIRRKPIRMFGWLWKFTEPDNYSRG